MGSRDAGAGTDPETVAGQWPGGDLGGRTRLLRRLLVGAGTLCALLLLVGAPASAHASLQSSTPGSDAVLRSAPSSVSLTFDEAVTLLPDSLRVFGPSGSRVDTGTATHGHGAAANASIALHGGLTDGTYLVSWRVVSADSHPVAGAFTFVVGHPSRAPAAAPAGTSAGSGTVDAALGVLRWLTYAGSALALGGLAFLCWCWPDGWRSARARGLLAGGGAALALGTLLALPLKGPYDAGYGLSRVTDVALLREVLGTTYGRALDVRLFLVALLVLVLTYREHLPRRVLAAAPAVLLLATGVTFALCGHAAAGDHEALAVASDTVHLVAMSLWLGGLVMLLAAVLPGGTAGEQARTAVLRFSTMASASVAVLIATGTYQSLREVRSFGALLHTHYGHLLLVKLGIVAFALFAAAGSRAWVWQAAHPVVAVNAATTAPPAARVGAGPGTGRLRASVAAETALLVGVLAVTAMLVTSNPARTAPQPHPVSANVRVGSDRVKVSAVPDGSRRLRLTLDVTDAAGRPTEPAEVTASFIKQSSQIGPLPVRLKGSSLGHRTATVSVPVTGTWQLAVTVRTSAIDEATAYVAVPVE